MGTDTERANLPTPVGNSCPSILINHLLLSCFHACLLPSPNTARLVILLKDIPFHPSFSLYWLLLILILILIIIQGSNQVSSHPRIHPSSDCSFSLCFFIPLAYLFLLVILWLLWLFWNFIDASSYTLNFRGQESSTFID